MSQTKPSVSRSSAKHDRSQTKMEIIMLGRNENGRDKSSQQPVIASVDAGSCGVVVIGGDTLFREGLKRLLQTAPFNLLGEAERLGDTESLKATGISPEIVVMVDAPADPKASWVGEIKALWKGCRIVTLSNGVDETMLSAALRAGVDGCLFKDMSPAALVQAINLVALGENVAPLRITQSLAAGGGNRAATVTEARLTPREKDILYGLLAGHSNKVIANTLGTTDMTVKAQLRHLLRKIGAANRTQAALWARENGIEREDAAQVERQAH